MKKQIGFLTIILGISLATVTGCSSISENRQTETSETEPRLISDEVSENNGENEKSTIADFVLIGEKNYIYTWEPKGKLKVSYQFYTVQDYNEKDYYFIKAMVTGIPGADLAEDDSNYKSKYKGTKIVVSLSSETSSVTRDSYGPSGEGDFDTFHVNVNMPAEGSYSWALEDAETDVSLTSAGAEWEFALTRGAKKAPCSVLPGIVFACPYNKDAITVTTSAEYTLDSWNTAKDELSIDKVFLCSPDDVLEK